MDGVIFASEDDFDRTAAATRYIEALRRNGGQPLPEAAARGLEVVVVKVTASSPTDTQYWLGSVTYKDFEAGVDEWYEEDEDSADNPKVYVVTLHGEKLAQNRRYIGVIIGEYDGYPVVLTADSRSTIKGKLDGALTLDGSATLSVWDVVGGVEVDTGENITVYDWVLSVGQTVLADSRVFAVWVANSGRWYVNSAQCTPTVYYECNEEDECVESDTITEFPGDDACGEGCV